MNLLTKRSRLSVPSLVNDFFNGSSLLPNLLDFNGGLLDTESSLAVPDANIIENDSDFSIELAAPGLDRKDFKVEVENKMLTISAEKESEKEEKNKNYRRREFSYNSFCRSFALPENSNGEKIEAKYENGVLRITVPKKEMTISKPVKEIKVS